MLVLNKQFIKEFLEISKSKKLKRDFEIIHKNRKKFMDEFSSDDYITFVTFFNRFIGHKRKGFVRIKGENFKL